MTRTNKFSRRQVLVGSGSTAVALSLGDLMFPSGLLAATPRTGGKLVYTSNSGNSKHKSLKKAMHPYFGLEIRTKNTYDALTWVDENLGVVPELATSWEADESQTVWEVDIREGVRFHDGRDLTADDVVASYMMHKDKKHGTSFSKKVISGVEKIGHHKVRFTLKTANSEFPWLMAEYRQAIMPAGPLGEMGYSGIGTGPFKFAKIDPGRRVIYEANEDYWGEGPYLDRLECIGQKGLDPVNGYLSGQFDAVLGADPGSVSRLAAAPDTKIDIAAAGDQILMVLPKYEGSPFMDRRIREALSLALDRDAIVRIVYAGKFGWVSNDTHMANVGGDFLPKDGVRDVAKAKKLLAEAGYAGGITLPTFYYSTYYPEIGRVFQVASESVKEAGITMPIEERPFDGYRKWRVEDKKRTRKHRFAMGPVGPRNPAANLFRMARATYNESGYWHPSPKGDEYIALFEKAMATGDPVARRGIYHEMQRLLQHEVPAIFLTGRREVVVSRSNVEGLRAHSQHWSVRFNGVWRS